MKRISLCMLPVIFFLATSEQCTESRDTQVQDTILEQRLKGIRAHFESDFLSESGLTEFEIIAKQKLTDLIDLFKILGDSSYEQSFREKAGEMIRESFISGNCNIKFIPDSPPEKDVATIEGVIHSGLTNHISFNHLVIDSLQIKNSFTREGESAYKTTIGFFQFSRNDTSGDQLVRKSKNEIEVYIHKEMKIFGDDSLWVWVLQFENMR